MIDYNFKVKSPSKEVALKMAEILVKKYGFSPEYIAKIEDTVLKKHYLFVYLTNNNLSISWISEHKGDYFIDHENKEINIITFIKTNGTMKPTKLLKRKSKD